MAQNNAKSSNTAITTPVAENESAKHLFVGTHLTINKKYAHGEQWNKVLLTNVNGLFQSLSIDKFLHLCEQIDSKKKFVQTIQKPIRGIFNQKNVDNPDIKIRGNAYFEDDYVLLEVLQSKDGSTALSRPDDVHQRMYFKIDEMTLFSYYNVLVNERDANAELEKLALERSVNDSECLSL
jgi:hypothetical protein